MVLNERFTMSTIQRLCTFLKQATSDGHHPDIRLAGMEHTPTEPDFGDSRDGLCNHFRGADCGGMSIRQRSHLCATDAMVPLWCNGRSCPLTWPRKIRLFSVLLCGLGRRREARLRVRVVRRREPHLSMCAKLRQRRGELRLITFLGCVRKFRGF